MNFEVDVNLRFEQPLNNILNHIVSEYFATFFAICVITSRKSNFKPTFPGSKVFLFDFDETTEDTKKLYHQGVEIGCQSFVISEEAFPNFLLEFYDVHDRCIQVFSNKHVVVYQSERLKEASRTEPNFPDSIDDLPNILFVEFKNDTFNFLTTKYVGVSDKSERLTLANIELIDDDFNEKLSSFNLFPEKRLDLEGREVTLALFNYLPYVLWKEVTAEMQNSREKITKNSLEIDGTESWVFLEFCKKHNCSLLISLDEEGEWGEISDNQTGNGILGAVAEKRAEVGVGALYSWYHESLFLSLSKPISRTGITCLTPKPSLLDPIGTPILPFSTNLWLAVLTCFVLSGICYKFLRKCQNYVEENSEMEMKEETFAVVYLNMLGIFVLQSVKMNLRQASIMFFFTSMLIVGLMIGNSYSSALSSVLTIPRFEKAIDTVEELAESKMEWGSTHDAWIFSIQLATQPMIVKLLAKFHTFSKEVLEQHAIKQDFSFSIERLPYGHYAIGDYVTEGTVNNYQIMLNDIYYELCVAMSTKTWPLMSQLDDLILHIAESGLQQFVELDVVMKNSNNKIQRAVAHSRHKDSIGPINLTPSHIIGPIIILSFGLIVSGISFTFELLFNRYKQKREVVPLL